MVPVPTILSSNAALASHHTELTGVFAGGTAGIGESTVRALARNLANRAPRVYIVGRNAAAAEKIIQDCRGICPRGTFEFVMGDLGLLRNVDGVCEEVKRRIGEDGRLDLLSMSQGYLTFDGRMETEEGLDVLFCLRYYGRMRMLHQLLPLLQGSDAAKVVSVFSPGKEGRLYTEDLGLRDPSHFGIFSGISHVSYMTTFFMEGVARRHPGVACVHVYPGLVKTEEFQRGLLPGWFKWFTRWIMLPMVTPWAVPLEECGERCLWAGTSGRFVARQSEGNGGDGRLDEEVSMGSDGVRGSGCYSVLENGEVNDNERMYGKFREAGLGEKIWEHTVSAFQEVEAGRKFLG